MSLDESPSSDRHGCDYRGRRDRSTAEARTRTNGHAHRDVSIRASVPCVGRAEEGGITVAASLRGPIYRSIFDYLLGGVLPGTVYLLPRIMGLGSCLGYAVSGALLLIPRLILMTAAELIAFVACAVVGVVAVRLPREQPLPTVLRCGFIGCATLLPGATVLRRFLVHPGPW